MRTKSIAQMEAQCYRIRVWRFNQYASHKKETTDTKKRWRNRLADMDTTMQRYRKNAYAYIWAMRNKGYFIGDETDYPIPASVYAKK